MDNSHTISQAKRIKQMFPTDSYDQFLSAELREIIESEKRITFTELLQQLHGVFPDDLYQKLSPLEKTQVIFKLENIKKQSSLWERIDINGVIPLPQLANYEWRYTEHSASKIINCLRDEDVICCFGTPTLALKLFDLNKQNETTVLDINVPMINSLRLLCSRNNFHWIIYNAINAPCSSFLNQYDVVFINPPWYLDYYKLFIYRAMQMLKDGGKVILPLFPCLSRQHAVDDLIELNSFIDKYSGVICHLGYVDFEMPPFEKEVLRKKDVPLPASNWRSAELISVSFERLSAPKNDIQISVNDYIEWQHFTSIQSNELMLINKKAFNALSNDSCITSETISSISRSSRNDKTILLWESATDRIFIEQEKKTHDPKKHEKRKKI